MNKYNEYYNTLTASTDPRQLAQSIISAERTDKRIRFRKPAVIAAAAVVAAGGVTAGAATGWNIPEFLGQLFNSRAQVHEITDYRSDIDFSEFGSELNIVREYEDFTINVTGISADSTTAYVLYDLIPNEGVNCSEWDIECDWEVNGFGGSELIRDIASGEIATDDSGIIHRYASAKFDTSSDFDTLAGKTLSLGFKVYIDEVYQPQYSASAPVEISVGFDISDDIKTVALNAPVNINGKDCVIKNVSLSTYAIEYTLICSEDDSEVQMGMYDVSYTFKGSDKQYRNHGSMSGQQAGNELTVCGMFSYPVNTEDITSVTIAGNTFELD